MCDLQPAMMQTIGQSQFLGLPLEIREIIYRYYFGYWTIVIQHNQENDRYDMVGVPNHGLIYANRQIHAECKRIRGRVYTGEVILTDPISQRKHGYISQSSLEVFSKQLGHQLLEQICTITVKGGDTGVLGLFPWHKMPTLKEVRLEYLLRSSSPFAIGLVSKIWPFEYKKDKSGRYQISGIYGWNDWTLVPRRVEAGCVRVICVRRGIVGGMCYRAVVEYQADCGEFIERVCEDPSDS